MRIGIFGGTFDPPHLGHKKYACEAIEKLALDRLIVMPTFIPPHKQHDGAPSGDRLAMTRLMFADVEAAEVSDMEIMRGGRSYTCDTVRILAQRYPADELIFFIGSDMLLSFHTWKNPQEILKYVKICAVCREENSDADVLREYVNAHFFDSKDSFIICDFEPLEISSTAIRNSVKNSQLPCGALDRRVMEYINKKELYR